MWLIMTPDEFMWGILIGFIAGRLEHHWEGFLIRVHFVGFRKVFQSAGDFLASFIPSQAMKRLRVAASACMIVIASMIFFYQGTQFTSDEISQRELPKTRFYDSPGTVDILTGPSARTITVTMHPCTCEELVDISASKRRKPRK